MKYLTITCNNAFNYGAVLQTYALNAYLNKCGHSGKVIDYKPAYLYKPITSNPIKRMIRPVIRFADFKKANKVFGNFISDYIPLTNTMKTSKDLREKLDKVDVYITGSDQVWNCSKGDVGNDDAFFLDFVKKDEGTKKISYAASIALSELPENQIERFKKLLKDFDHISVREKTGVNIIKELGYTNAVQVLDPVYLLSKDDWMNLVNKSKLATKLKKQKYVLVYAFLQQKNVFNYAKKMAKKKKCKLFSVNTWIEDYFMGTDKYYWNVTPEDFLALIYYSEAVVTNSFHGLSFSLIFNKDFYLFKKNGNTSSRMLDMAESVCLHDRIINDDKLDKEPIDYSIVNAMLNNKIEESKKYLQVAFAKSKDENDDE